MQMLNRDRMTAGMCEPEDTLAIDMPFAEGVIWGSMAFKIRMKDSLSSL